MRSSDMVAGSLFSYVDLEKRVRADHPLRVIREIVNAVLLTLSPDFDLLYVPEGYDAGKKIKGRKRHIVTDTLGHLIGLLVHLANIQDRDGGAHILASIRTLYLWLREVFADGGCAGEKLRVALAARGAWTLEIIKRSDTAKGFQVSPRRRLAKNFEASLFRRNSLGPSTISACSPDEF